MRWSMDFIADSFCDGRRFRTLNIIDDFSRECLGIEVDTSLSGKRVVRVFPEPAKAEGSVGAGPSLVVSDIGASTI